MEDQSAGGKDTKAVAADTMKLRLPFISKSLHGAYFVEQSRLGSHVELVKCAEDTQAPTDPC